ncbi:hemolysin-III related-domain-containing protein [Mycena rebaudengoi]|nr:hemolysin-III related-domain-containing protein [Mycena rebaudengoi]
MSVRRRRMSDPASSSPKRPALCRPLSLSLEALDLSFASPAHALVSLRFLVLSYLADLERRLSLLESPDWRAKGELTIEEARQWARTALDMLHSIRTDVCSHLPDSDSLLAHLPDLPNSESLLARLPDMPNSESLLSHFPDSESLRAHLPDLPNLGNMVAAWHDLDLGSPLSFVPTLSARLKSLQSHLAALPLPSPSPSAVLADLLDKVMHELEPASAALKDDVDTVAHALKHSLDGLRLISYAHLPAPWRNNPFVGASYRFIPLERYPALAASVFALHNESLNIHTHLLPLVLCAYLLLHPAAPLPSDPLEPPERLFAAFVMLCLACSVLWHTMAGCAHFRAMDFCARLDYVGIGWLISVSIATVVYYGYTCHPAAGYPFLALCLVCGVAGNVLPFMQWFNEYENRLWRLAFFLTLSFSALCPLAGIALLHSYGEMLRWAAPITPSLLYYVLGLVFYAAQVPERFLTPRWRARFDRVGLGSHAIWHCCIVLAMNAHREGLHAMRAGVGGGCAVSS